MSHDTSEARSTDNISIAVYDAGDVSAAAEAATAKPKRTYETHNATRGSYHETIVAALDGIQADLTVDALALGDSTMTTADVPDGDPLGNELFRTTPTDTFTDGQTFTASVFLDSTEANGNSYEEAALVAEQSDGSDVPINRFLIDDPGGLLSPKSENETVTIDIEITQEDR